MKLGRVALLLVAATALQFFVGGSRHRAAWPVDCFLIATAVVARGGNPSRAVLVGGILGFLEDAFAHELLGMNAFAKALLGYVLAVLSVRVVFGGSWAVGGALAAASLVNDGIVALLSLALLRAPLVLFSRESLWRAVATGVTGGVLEAARKFPGASGGSGGCAEDCDDESRRRRRQAQAKPNPSPRSPPLTPYAFRLPAAGGRHAEDPGRPPRAGAPDRGLADHRGIGLRFPGHGVLVLQIVRGEHYYALSENNRIRSVRVMAPRGYVLDRHGSILVDNQPGYTLHLYRREAKNIEASVDFAAAVLKLPRDQVRARVERGLRDPEFLPITVAENLAIEDVAAIEARAPEHPEFVITVAQRRLYTLGTAAAHALGYLSEATAEQVARQARTSTASETGWARKASRAPTRSSWREWTASGASSWTRTDGRSPRRSGSRRGRGRTSS